MKDPSRRPATAAKRKGVPKRLPLPTTIAVFNPKGGVGKTTLTHHLACMLGIKGKKVLVADLDVMQGLTALSRRRMEHPGIWERSPAFQRQYGFRDGEGQYEYSSPVLLNNNPIFDDEIFLHAALQNVESYARTGRRSLLSSLASLREVQDRSQPDLTLVDLGPGLPALTQVALLGCTDIIIPVMPDRFAEPSFRAVATALLQWQEQRGALMDVAAAASLAAGPVDLRVLGYVVMRHGQYDGRLTRADQHWLKELPNEFRGNWPQPGDTYDVKFEGDDRCIGTFRDCRSSMQVAQEVGRPMFTLEPDGGFINRRPVVRACYEDVEKITDSLLNMIADRS